MSRNELILSQIKKSGKGLEIGPSHAPIAPKRNGYDVDVLDHLSQQELIKKYAAHHVATEDIEEVDFVWNGEPYLELIGRPKRYDWIIASHVIEHTPDLIRFLQDCDDILKDDGRLVLVIPDKRYCFDHFRPLTSLSTIIDAHAQGHTIHTVGSAVEYFLTVVSKDGHIAWNHDNDGHFEFVHSLEEALSGKQNIEEDGAYLDVHAWCFTPHAFRLAIHDLNKLGYTQLQEVDFHDTVGCEFYMTLGRTGSGLATSRMEALGKIREELCRKSRRNVAQQSQPAALKQWLVNLLQPVLNCL